MKFRRLPLICALFLFVSPRIFAVTYSTIDYPGSIGTQAEGINNNGDVVGGYSDAAGAGHGFLLSGGVYTPLDVPGGQNTFATDINDSGVIVGHYFDLNTLGESGFVFQAGNFSTIDFPGVGNTFPCSINNGGEIVGFYSSGVAEHGFEFSTGVWTSLDAPHSSRTFVTGINKKGDLLGVYYDTRISPVLHGFTEGGGVVHILRPPSANLTVQFTGKINDFGQGVGEMFDSNDSSTSGLLFQPAATFKLLVNISTFQPPFMSAKGINNRGQIVGYYFDSANVVHGFAAVR